MCKIIGSYINICDTPLINNEWSSQCIKNIPKKAQGELRIFSDGTWDMKIQVLREVFRVYAVTKDTDRKITVCDYLGTKNYN